LAIFFSKTNSDLSARFFPKEKMSRFSRAVDSTSLLGIGLGALAGAVAGIVVVSQHANTEIHFLKMIVYSLQLCVV
jgi:hypothetical protein